MDILVIVNKAKDHPIKTALTVVGIFVAIFFGRYSWLNYKEAHTPCIDIERPIFFFQAGDKPGLNVTGIIIDIVNQSNAWAKNVRIDFINDDELLEVTPKNLRIRKKYLSTVDRKIHDR